MQEGYLLVKDNEQRPYSEVTRRSANNVIHAVQQKIHIFVDNPNFEHKTQETENSEGVEIQCV